MYDEHYRRLTRRGQPVARPANIPTPCHMCPKQNPSLGRRIDRDLESICRQIDLYWQVRGTQGRCFAAPDAIDPILVRNLGLIDAALTRAQIDRACRHYLHALLTKGKRR
jgi:hypothetical protein